MVNDIKDTDFQVACIKKAMLELLSLDAPLFYTFLENTITRELV